MGRGNISLRENGTYRVRVYAGKDPITGKQRYLTGTAPTQRAAERLARQLLSEVDRQRAPRSNMTVAQMIQNWLDTAELEQTTRDSYSRYIANQILPVLGKTQARKVTVETLERFYAHLRKEGGAGGRPLANSSVRQVHFILRASYRLAVKWGSLSENPAALATPPKFTREEVRPPSLPDAQRLLEDASKRDPDFGALLWIAMITGMRRGELLALRWPHVRFGAGDVLVSRNYVESTSGRREKDTKTHQARRIALDEVTIGVLREHHERCRQRAQACGTSLLPDGFVFSRSVDGHDPTIPHTASQRLARLAKRVGLGVTFRSLRHFMGTAMLTDGTDLRTVAGRLGHGDGGSTTLRVYTHFLPAPDRRAAERLARSMLDRGPAEDARRASDAKDARSV